MKIKITEKNEKRIKRKINEKWNEANSPLYCNIDSDVIFWCVHEVAKVITKMGRSICDYDKAKIKYDENTDNGLPVDRLCLNFEIRIIKKDFFLTDLSLSKIVSNTSHIKLILKPNRNKSIMCERYYLDKLENVSVRMTDNIVRMKFPTQEIEFEYWVGDIKVLNKVFDGFASDISNELITIIKEYFKKYYRTYKLKKHLNELQC